MSLAWNSFDIHMTTALQDTLLQKGPDSFQELALAAEEFPKYGSNLKGEASKYSQNYILRIEKNKYLG